MLRLTICHVFGVKHLVDLSDFISVFWLEDACKKEYNYYIIIKPLVRRDSAEMRILCY